MKPVILDGYMSEDTLMEEIRKACFNLRLMAYHVPDSRRAWSPGFPDLVIAGPGGTLLRESKDRDNSLKPEQRRWGSYLERSGIDWAVWRPRDLLNGTIMRQLVRIAGTPKEAM